MAKKMTSGQNKRRATAVAALATAMATRTPAAASFAGVAAPFASSTKRSHAALSTKLLASEGDSPSETAPTMETITDENRHALLRPPADPSRPVLVDAFAPWCGPCKLLDKVLRKAAPRYTDRVDFCRWNVNDKESTVELKTVFLESGFTLTKLPSLIVFKEGKPVAVRAGMANEFQLDAFLEKSLPELERTFDDDGLKMIPLPLPEEEMIAAEEKKPDAKRAKEEDILRQMKDLTFNKAETTPEATVENVQQVVQKVIDEESKVVIEEGDCTDPVECWERIDQTLWQNRTVVPAMDGILLPARSYVSP